MGVTACLVAGMLLLSVTGVLGAQQPREQTDISFAGRCVEAATVVRAGEPIPTWARVMIGRCPVAGTPVVKEYWSRVRDDTTALNELSRWTFSLTTLEAMSAALDAASDPSRPVNVRLAALAVSVGGLDSSLTVAYRLSDTGRPAARLVYQLPKRARLMGADYGLYAARVTAALQAMATSDPAPPIQAASRALWGEIADNLPALSGIEPGLIAVEALCGGRFRITNKTPVALSLGLVRDAIPGRGTRARPGYPVIARFAVQDSLVVMFAGKRLAAVAPDRSKCP